MKKNQNRLPIALVMNIQSDAIDLIFHAVRSGGQGYANANLEQAIKRSPSVPGFKLL